MLLVFMIFMIELTNQIAVTDLAHG